MTEIEWPEVNFNFVVDPGAPPCAQVTWEYQCSFECHASSRASARLFRGEQAAFGTVFVKKVGCGLRMCFFGLETCFLVWKHVFWYESQSKWAVSPENQFFKTPTFQPKTYFRPENQNSNKNCSRHSSSPNGDPARPSSAKFSTNTRTASTCSSHYSSVAATSPQNHFHATPKRILTSKQWKKTSTF